MADSASYDVLLKILLVGDTGSNKTELLQEYVKDDKKEEEIGVTGLDYYLKDIVYKGKRIKLQLWDTAGQERFRSVTTSYYRGSHGCLLTFNLAKTSSFSGLNYWLGEIRTNAPTRFQTVLVGTGVGDPNADGQLDIAREFARDQQLTLKEINVTNQAQVQDAFNTLIDKIMTNLNKKNLSDEESIRLRTPVMTDRPPKCLC